MKKLLRHSYLSLFALLFLLSCQYNQHVSTPINNEVIFIFSDNVINGEFQVQNLNQNSITGKLILKNTQNSKISFPFRDIHFQNESSVGKMTIDYSKDIKEYEVQKELKKKEMANLSKEERMHKETREKRSAAAIKKLMEMNSKGIVEANVELDRKEKKSYPLKIEFENEIADVANVKVMLKGFYKQLLSKN